MASTLLPVDMTQDVAMRVMSWNLWWQFGPWEQRQAAIASTIRDVGADVIMIQESWVDQAKELAAGNGFHLATSDRPHMVNAVLSKWPIIRTHTIALPASPGRPAVRHLVVAVLDSPFGPLTACSTHLDQRFDASALRQAQLALICEEINTVRGDPASQLPVIVGADLNAVPDSDEIRALTGRRPPYVNGLVFTDAWEVAGDGTAGHTWTIRNPHLATAGWPNRRLDYILVSWPRPDGSPLTPVRCWLEGEPATADGLWPSDHLAVVADLRPPLATYGEIVGDHAPR
jgi:endonuclease/exonuclease/phosphatase family metal-dependent hydrolase